MMLAGTLLAMVFIAAGCVFELSRLNIGFAVNLPMAYDTVTFDFCFYYLMVTVSTTGYGDIRPDSDLARFLVSMFIIMILVVISKQTSELSELMKSHSEFEEPYKGNFGSHIILVGEI